MCWSRQRWHHQNACVDDTVVSVVHSLLLSYLLLLVLILSLSMLHEAGLVVQ